MAVKPLADILASVNTLIGENTSDEALTLIEDITDSFNDAVNSNTEYTKEKYEELDRSWRERYKERFLSGDKSLDPKEEDDDTDDERPKTYKYEDLFKEG